MVTLKVVDRPLKEVFEELSHQSGIRVEGVELSEDLRVSLDVERVLVWEAVDRLCRGTENLMFTFTPRRVLLREGAYRAIPYASRRGFLFMVDSLFNALPNPMFLLALGGLAAVPLPASRIRSTLGSERRHDEGLSMGDGRIGESASAAARGLDS